MTDPFVTQPAPAPAPAPQIYVQPGPPAPIAPPPPRVNPNRGLGLTVAGFSMFGVSYLITAASGTVAIDAGSPEVGRPLLIPVAGPFIAATRVGTATGGFGLAFVGVVQLAGLAMGIAGSVKLAKSRREARFAASSGGFEVKF